MDSNTVSILDGNTFVVSDRRGDIEASPVEPTGLFSYDTRYLSRWLLTVDGARLRQLSVDDLDYFSVQFFLVPDTGAVSTDADFSILRKRTVSNGFFEDVLIQNHRSIPMDLVLCIELDADFADLFEIKDALSKKRTCYRRVDHAKRELLLGYRRERFICETSITSTAAATINEQSFIFAIHLEPHQEWKTSLSVEVAPSTFKSTFQASNIDKHKLVQEEKSAYMQQWLASAPLLSCEWRWLERIYRRCLIDLAALRFAPNIDSQKSIPAAGLPWFMTIFGRDSIITSLQALPFAPELAEATLLTLAAWQGSVVDDFREEEPGKILHELRYGEMTAFGERPHSPYYGTADATPLFLILLDEYERWTGDGTLVCQLKAAARDALTWIDRYGDSNGDGYVEYARRNKQIGLENQCWKDSWDSILFADGTLAALPRATCEIQGYVYDAKIRCARLARKYWHDPALADRMEQEAANLKRHFNEDFWLPERGFFALAIDGEGRKVDALTSNIGHLLWSGIVEQEKAGLCVDHLMSQQLFSGWGVRTMAEGEGGYNPVGYHIGTVWPHDNSLIAWGLRRYGFYREAARIIVGMLEAAAFFNGRLPEAFAGYDWRLTSYPVEYPTACSPQAWSTGTPLLLIRTMMGLEPVDGNLLINPAVPLAFGRIDIFDIPGCWGRIDAFARGKIDVGTDQDIRRYAL